MIELIIGYLLGRSVCSGGSEDRYERRLEYSRLRWMMPPRLGDDGLPITDKCSYVYCECEDEDCIHSQRASEAWAKYWKGYKRLQDALGKKQES